MPLTTKLLAWIEPHPDDGYLAAIVGGDASGRAPATRVCRSPEEARQWVEAEAAAIGAPVEWLPGDRRRAPRPG
jgi:hypothetical protein